MKRFLIIALLTAASVTVFASDEKKPSNGSKDVSFSALNQFAIEFADATSVQWTITPKFQKATFLLDGEKASAFYSLSGEYLGATKFVAADRIPSKAKTELAKKYADYQLSYALQVISRPATFDASDDTGSFWIDLVSGEKELYAKVSAFGSIETVKEIN
jgi:hypothetical protein